jgi:hypothetical protein
MHADADNTANSATSAPHPTDAGAPRPLAQRVAEASSLSGLSRSAIYREAARGRIVLLKHGRTTLVDMASLRAFLASLPPAVFGARRGAA